MTTPDLTCAACAMLKECESAFGAPGDVGLGCADWTPAPPPPSPTPPENHLA